MTQLTSAHLRALGHLLSRESPKKLAAISRGASEFVSANLHRISPNELHRTQAMYREAWPYERPPNVNQIIGGSYFFLDEAPWKFIAFMIIIVFMIFRRRPPPSGPHPSRHHANASRAGPDRVFQPRAGPYIEGPESEALDIEGPDSEAPDSEALANSELSDAEIAYARAQREIEELDDALLPQNEELRAIQELKVREARATLASTLAARDKAARTVQAFAHAEYKRDGIRIYIKESKYVVAKPMVILNDGCIAIPLVDQGIHIWDPLNNRERLIPYDDPEASILVLAYDGTPTASPAVKRTAAGLHLINLKNGTLALTQPEGVIHIYDPNTSKKLYSSKPGNWDVSVLYELPDTRLAAGFTNGDIIIYNPDGSPSVNCARKYSSAIKALVSPPQVGRGDVWMASCTVKSDFIRVYKIADGTLLHKITPYPGNLLAALPQEDKIPARLASSCGELVCIWDDKDFSLAHLLRGHDKNVSALTALPGGMLASGDQTGEICVWNTTTGACVHVLKSHNSSILALATLPSANGAPARLVSSGSDKIVYIWNYSTGRLDKKLTYTDPCRYLGIMGDGTLVMGYCTEGASYTVRLWK